MNQVWVTLIAALAGTVIGSLTLLASVAYQTRAARRRELNRLAVEAAVAEYKGRIEVTAMGSETRSIYPLGCYVFYYEHLLDLLDKGTLKPESYADLYDEQTELIEIITAAAKRRRSGTT